MGIEEKLIKDIMLCEKIVSNTEYMEWLYEFTKKHNSFASITWLYESHCISQEDNCKVEKLQYLFGALEKYYTKNLLNMCSDKCDAYFVIKYKDIYFQIGLCVGQGSFYYVERIETTNSEYVLFEDVMNKKTHESVEAKRSKLSELEQLLKEMKDMKMPYDEVSKVLGRVFR